MTETLTMPKDFNNACIAFGSIVTMFLSIWLAGVFAFPIGTMSYLLFNSSGYVDTTLTVESVNYESGNDIDGGLSFFWAEGIVESDKSRQRCALNFGYSHVASEDELRAMVPEGKKFAVKYNPNMMRTAIQGSTPRLINNEFNDAFSRLWRSTISYLIWALVPLVSASILFYYIGRPCLNRVNSTHRDEA